MTLSHIQLQAHVSSEKQEVVGTMNGVENIFSSRRKVMSDVAAPTADGKLFHGRGAATANAQSPKVDHGTARTVSVVDVDHPTDALT